MWFPYTYRHALWGNRLWQVSFQVSSIGVLCNCYFLLNLYGSTVCWPEVEGWGGILVVLKVCVCTVGRYNMPVMGDNMFVCFTYCTHPWWPLIINSVEMNCAAKLVMSYNYCSRRKTINMSKCMLCNWTAYTCHCQGIDRDYEYSVHYSVRDHVTSLYGQMWAYIWVWAWSLCTLQLALSHWRWHVHQPHASCQTPLQVRPQNRTCLLWQVGIRLEKSQESEAGSTTGKAWTEIPLCRGRDVLPEQGDAREGQAVPSVSTRSMHQDPVRDLSQIMELSGVLCSKCISRAPSELAIPLCCLLAAFQTAVYSTLVYHSYREVYNRVIVSFIVLYTTYCHSDTISGRRSNSRIVSDLVHSPILHKWLCTDCP